MSTLEQEFSAYLDTERLKREFAESTAFKQYQADVAGGGAIRQGPAPVNPPIGATVGGVAGMLAGGPVGGVAGSLLGEAGQQLTERVLGSPAAPQTSLEAAKRLTQEAALGAVGEGVGRGLAKLGTRAAAPFAASIQPEAEAAMRFLEPRTRLPLLPAEATSSRILDILENVSESSLLGGGAIKAFKEKRYAEVFDKIAKEMVDDLGPRLKPDEVGRAVIDTISRNKELATIPAKMQYEAIERAAAPDYFDAISRMKVQRMDVPIEREVIANVRVTPEIEEVTKEAMKRMKVKETNTPVRSTDKLVGFDDEGDRIMERVESGGKLTHIKIRTTRQDVPVGDELRGLNVKTTFQNIQVGEQLQHLKVMVATQEQQISGARIDLTSLKDTIAGAVQVAKQAGGLSDREMGNTLLKFIAEKPDMVSYPVAKQLRTEIRTLRDVLQKTPETKNAPAIGKANKVYDELTQSIRRGLGEYDSFLAQQWDEANLVERGANLQFANKITQKLVTKADERNDGSIEAIGEKIFSGGLSTIRKAKNAIADESTWNTVLSGNLSDVLQRSINPETKQIQAKELNRLLFGPDGIGQQAMVTAYGPERTQRYRNFINALEQTQKKQGEGTGRILIQLAQGGALLNVAGNVTGLVDTGFEAESGAIILGPPVLARLMTNPQTARWLIQGFSAPANTATSMALAGRLLQAAFPRPARTDVPDTAERRTLSRGATGLAPVRPMEVQP